MRIEVRNFVQHPYLNGDTKAFSADLFINDKSAGYLFDRGTADFRWEAGAGDGVEVYYEAREYCESLPPYTNTVLGIYEETTTPMLVACDLITRHLANVALDTYYEEILEQTKSEIAWRKRITLPVPEDVNMEIYGESVHNIVLSAPVAELLKSAEGMEELKKAIAQCRERITHEEVLLNNNLPAALVQGFNIEDITSKKATGVMVHDSTLK